MTGQADDTLRIRLDKWLWAARFFKTRSLATQAVNGGRVHVNDARVKPARVLRVGDRVRVSKGELTLDVLVRALAERRGPAAAAAELYQETPESVARREAQREERRLRNAAASAPPGRPSKRDRRRIVRFTGKGGAE